MSTIFIPSVTLIPFTSKKVSMRLMHSEAERDMPPPGMLP